jgi:hypothetical protein
VPLAVSRVYAAVHVDMDANDEFHTTFGADAAALTANRAPNAVTVTPATHTDTVTHTTALTPTASVTAYKSVDPNAMECSEDDTENVLENILCSDDVTTWSPTQQDFSELDYLANNASSSSSGSSCSSSSSSSSGDVSSIDKGNPKRILTETSKEMIVEKINGVEKEVEKGSISKEKDKDKGMEKRNEKEDKDKGKGRHIVPLLLEMTEPNPDTSHGMDLWLLWFDGLKEKENTLTSLLSQ